MTAQTLDSVQPSLFDLRAGKARRDQGIARVAGKHADWLAQARAVAVRICQEKGTVCADCLRAAGVEQPMGGSPNIFGAIFHDSRFAFVRYVYSARPEAHHNLIRSWRLA